MRRETVKSKAQAFLLLSVMWSLFSGFGVFDWLDAHRSLSLNPNCLFDFVIWGLHLVFISLAVHFARTERAGPTLCLNEDLWIQIAVHACWWILFANLPLFAIWQGSWVGQVLVHGLLILISAGGFVVLRKVRTTRLYDVGLSEPTPQQAATLPETGG